MAGCVWFVGAGPGAADLITVRGRDLIASADAILYAGSLVSQAALQWAPSHCAIEDSKGMTLEEITAWLIDKANNHTTVIRLQTGDPTLYGALTEMLQPLDAAGISTQVVPGISSALAAAAIAQESLTLPEITQTVIFTRVAGRTPMPDGEQLSSLAQHHCTLCLFLSITLLKTVRTELLAAGWSDDSPVLVVQKASWPNEEKVVRTNLRKLRDDCQQENIVSQAMIIISPTLEARSKTTLIKSKLYSADFSHRFRKATVPPSSSIEEPTNG